MKIRALLLAQMCLAVSLPALAEDPAPATLVAVSFQANSYIGCVAHLTALGLDGRTVLLPDGETKDSYCHKQFPDVSSVSPVCHCPMIRSDRQITGHGPPPCECALQEN